MRATRLGGPLRQFSLVAASLLFSLSAQSLSLDAFLREVRRSHGGVQAFELSKEAAQLRRGEGDLSLSPILTAQGTYYDLYPPPFLIPILGARKRAFEPSLQIAKQFDTGAALSALFEQGFLTLGLQQSLWKNSFGNGVRARRDREGWTERLTRLGAEAQLRQLLIGAETAFWDAVYQREERKLRNDGLQRAERIVSWAQKRVKDGVADRADLLQFEALLSGRRLELISADDEARATEQKLRDSLSLGPAAGLPALEAAIDRGRDPRMLAGLGADDKAAPLRLDALIASHEAHLREAVAAETVDALAPDLDLQISHSRKVTSRADETIDPHPNYSISAKFSVDLDFKARRTVGEAARVEAHAASLRAGRARLESESSWCEILRRHGELSKRIEAAHALAEVQTERLKRERERLRIGRTITLAVVQAEQEEAESRLALLRLQTEQRKLEAQAANFVGPAEEEAL